MPFMSAGYVIYTLYVHVFEVVYAASSCSHRPCYNETAGVKTLNIVH